jgi:lysophospholipase
MLDRVTKKRQWEIESGKFFSYDGIPLYYKSASTSRRPGDVDQFHLIIVHGLVEYHNRHQFLWEYLLEKFQGEFRVSWIDLRGHGLSSGARAHVDRFDDYAQDLISFLNFSQEICPQKSKTILFGHSLGGLVVVKTALDLLKESQVQVDGLILSNPCLKAARRVEGWQEQGLGMGAKLLSRLRVPSIYSGKDLTQDEALSREFDLDPLISKFVTLGLLNQILITTQEVRHLSYFLDLPSLFLLSGKDELVDVKTTQLFVKGISKDLVTDFFYHDKKHELLNEIGRDIVANDILQWIMTRTREEELEK